MTSPVAAGGLILDVAGALTLASAFMFKRPRDIHAEAATYFDRNGPLLLSFAKQKADACVGAVLLVLGFAGQMDGALGSHSSRLAITIPLGLFISCGAYALLTLWLRPLSVKRTMQWTLASDFAREGASQRVPATIIWFSRVQGRQIQEGETPEALARWLIGNRRWRHLTARYEVPESVRQPHHQQVNPRS